jgi:hypothetical protein
LLVDCSNEESKYLRLDGVIFALVQAIDEKYGKRVE